MGPMTRVGWTRDDEVDVNELVESPGIVRPPWRIVSAGSTVVRPEPPLRARQVYLQLVTVVVVILLAVGVLGAFASRAVAEQEAVHDASERADIIADAVIQPALRDGLLQQEPTALAVMDAAVRQHVLNAEIVRVKLWAANGTSSTPTSSGSSARRSSSARTSWRPVEPADQGRGVPTWTDRRTSSSGTAASCSRSTERCGLRRGESCCSRSTATTGRCRTGQRLWRGLVGVFGASLLLLLVLMAPVVLRLLDRLGAAQRQREALLSAPRRPPTRSGDESRPPARRCGAGTGGSSLRGRGRGLPRGPTVAPSWPPRSRMPLRPSATAWRACDLAGGDLPGAARRGRARRGPRRPRAAADQPRRRGEPAVTPTTAALLSDTEQQVVHRVTRECLRNVASTPVRARFESRWGASRARRPTGRAHDRRRRGWVRRPRRAGIRGPFRSARAGRPRHRVGVPCCRSPRRTVKARVGGCGCRWGPRHDRHRCSSTTTSWCGPVCAPSSTPSTTSRWWVRRPTGPGAGGRPTSRHRPWC